MSSMQVKMSLDTLLEAARYLDLQEELKAKQQRQAEISVAMQLPPLPPPPPPPLLLRPPSPSPPLSLLKQELTATVPPLTSTTATSTTRIIHNSFDIINPLVIDEGGEQKRKQPPLAFRSGTREVHNKLEKHRRAHLKECFDVLKRQLPTTADEKKASNLSILHSALCHIQSLKRRERELEHEMERLAREKIAHQQRLAVLKKEVAAQCDGIDFSALLPDITVPQSAPHHEIINSEQVVHEIRTIETPVTMADQRVPRIPPMPRPVAPASINGFKEGNQMQTAALSMLPVAYPMSQGLVLQKVALVPKGLTDLSPLVSSPAVAHFITAPQQMGGKVVPLVNAQYVVKPVVVVSTASRPS